MNRAIGIFCLLVGFTAAAAVRGQSVEERPLRPTPAHAKLPDEETIYRTTALDDRGFNRVVPVVPVPTLTIYHPAAPRADHAALVVCPGGGYKYVVIDREGHMIARYFQSRGFTVAVLKYRLPDPPATGDGLPLSQQDSLEAMRYVRSHATEWQVNPHRVGVMGFSAGGHLAGSTAIFGKAEDGSRPDFAVLGYPVITLADPYAHVGSREKLLGLDASPERVEAYSLDRQVRPGLPPFFIVHAMDDKIVPPENSRMMEAALKAANVPVKLLLVERGGHGFALGRGPESVIWPDEFLHWLDSIPMAP